VVIWCLRRCMQPSDICCKCFSYRRCHGKQTTLLKSAMNKLTELKVSTSAVKRYCIFLWSKKKTSVLALRPGQHTRPACTQTSRLYSRDCCKIYEIFKLTFSRSQLPSSVYSLARRRHLFDIAAKPIDVDSNFLSYSFLPGSHANGWVKSTVILYRRRVV